MKTAVKRSLLSQDVIAQNLLDRFIFGDEAPEGMLPSTRMLAEEFGVSRLFMREVLAGLQRQGLLESVPGKGVFVRKPDMLNAARNVHTAVRQSSATARDLIVARSHLEEQCAKLAAENATDADIEQLETALEAFDSATSLIPRAQADIAFHALIAKSTQNPVLQIMFGSITTLTFETMLRSLSDPKIFDIGAPLHHSIMKSIKKKDGKAASRYMSQHLHLAEDVFSTDLERPLSEIAERIVKDVLHSTASVDEILSLSLKDYEVGISR